MVFLRHLSIDSFWLSPRFLGLRVLLRTWLAPAMSHCHVALPTSLAAHGTGFTMTGSPQDLSKTSAGGLGRAEQKVGLGWQPCCMPLSCGLRRCHRQDTRRSLRRWWSLWCLAPRWRIFLRRRSHQWPPSWLCRLEASSAICRTLSSCRRRLTWLPLAVLSRRFSPPVAT